jgi:hypothetical protein
MAQNVIINGVTYQNVPEVNIPKSGGGTAKFMDTSDANALQGEILSGKTAYVNGSKVTGNIASKAAATITPTSADQTISAQQYLSGAQTIEGIVCTNLSSANIAQGVTVKIGTASDDDSVATVVGSLSAVVVSQDSTTKVLSIS